MKVLQIATFGEEEDEIFIGIREFPASKIVLVHEPGDRSRAMEILRKLAILKIEGDRRELRDPAKDMYEVVSEIIAGQGPKFDDVLINVSSGRKMMTCSAISAAFVNGVKAFHVEDNRAMMLPVLKFSYSEIVSDAKLEILRALDRLGGAVDSLNELSEKSGIDKSLLSYHIRGGRESTGLEKLGLVEVDRSTRGRLVIRITAMGKILLLGRQSPKGPDPK